MAVQPLSPATDRRLGRPLPYQLSNQTRVHLWAISLWHINHAIIMLYAVLAPVSSCYSPLTGRLLTRYSPVRHWSILPKGCISPFDLNVLCTPPALILSQDQTLHNISLLRRFIRISFFFSGSLRIWQEFLLVHFLSLLLFNFQRPSSASSATAFLLYHPSSPLSSTFFAFFYFFLMPPLHLYSYISFMYVLNCFFRIFIIFIYFYILQKTDTLSTVK